MPRLVSGDSSFPVGSTVYSITARVHIIDHRGLNRMVTCWWLCW